MSKAIIEDNILHDIVNSMNDKFETPLKLKDNEIAPTINNIKDSSELIFGKTKSIIVDEKYSQPKVISYRPDIFQTPVVLRGQFITDGINIVSNLSLDNKILYNTINFNPLLTGQYNVILSNKPGYREYSYECNFWGFNTPENPIDISYITYDDAYFTDTQKIFTNPERCNQIISSKNANNQGDCLIGKLSDGYIFYGKENNSNGIKAPSNVYNLFSDEFFSNLTVLDLSYFDTSKVTNMSGMFNYCTYLTNLDISHFDTSKVTNMSIMFFGCSSLTTLDLSSFDTSQVTNMENMFSSCTNLTTLDLSSFNTSKVTSMYDMFRSCRSLTTLDLSSFNTSRVTNMYNMFNGCSSLTTLDLSYFDTSKVTNMGGMFSDCLSLATLDLSNFNTSKVTDMSDMFYRCPKLKTVYCRNQEEINRYKATNPPANINFVIKGGAN